MEKPEYILFDEALALLKPYRIGRSTVYAKHIDSEEKRTALGVVMGPYGLLWELSRLTAFIHRIHRSRTQPGAPSPGAPRFATDNLPSYSPCLSCNRRSNSKLQCRWCGATGASYRSPA